jgi:hypothetical protein
MEQQKAMEYERRKASSDVLKPRYIYIYIYIYIYVCVLQYANHTVLQTLMHINDQYKYSS